MGKFYDDDILIKRVIDGDENLFGELINRYQGLVYGLAYGKVSNFADAQDIAQDVFIKAYRKLDQLEDRGNFAAWLKTITANECKNWLRQKKATIPLEYVEPHASYNSFESIDHRNQTFKADVLQSVDALSQNNRTVITLFYLSGLSYEEISEALNIPVATVANRMLRARRQLKAELMSRVESAMTSLRLPETFAEGVLTRLTLCPLEPGRTFGTKSAEEGILVIGVPGGKSHLLLLAMSREGMEAVENSGAGNPIENPKILELISMKRAMESSKIKPKEVILYLGKKSSCYAKMIVMQRRTEKTLDLKVCDALFLAFKMGIPVMAESNLIDKGIAGTDGISYEILDNLYDFRSDLPSISQRGCLEIAAFRAAPLEMRGNHSVQCSTDFNLNTIRLSVLDTDITVELDLNKYLLGLGDLLCDTHENGKYSLLDDDKGIIFKVTFSSDDGEVIINFEPHTGTLCIEH
ncbi:MAG: RNA polymerase sigma factor [Armatimonadota bacterium]